MYDNPVFIDPRVGSRDLIPDLKRMGVPVEHRTQLEFGDAAWVGSGRDGDVLVGVERKNIRDLLQSMRSNRLSGHQAAGMVEAYPVRYLVVEGLWRCGKAGELEWWWKGEWKAAAWPPDGMSQQPYFYGEAVNYLQSAEEMAGFRIRRTSNPLETAGLVKALWSWWQKPYDKHTAMGVGEGVGGAIQDVPWCGSVKVVRPNLVWAMVSQIKQMQGQRARRAGYRFRSPQEMALAPVEEWLEVLTEKDGKGKRRVMRKLAAEVARLMAEGR